MNSDIDEGMGSRQLQALTDTVCMTLDRRRKLSLSFFSSRSKGDSGEVLRPPIHG